MTITLTLAVFSAQTSTDADPGPAILAASNRSRLTVEAPCTVPGLSRRLGAGTAALLNGTFGHSLGFYDPQTGRSLHPTAPVIPVAGRLMGLTSEQMMSAFGVAASQASGSLRFLQNGAWNKHCHMGETTVGGLFQMQHEHGWSGNDIDYVRVSLHRKGIALVGAPLDDKRRARNLVEGQFSMPFTAAVALLRGRFDWDAYDLLGDPRADALADRIEVLQDATPEDSRPFRYHPESDCHGQGAASAYSRSVGQNGDLFRRPCNRAQVRRPDAARCERPRRGLAGIAANATGHRVRAAPFRMIQTGKRHA